MGDQKIRQDVGGAADGIGGWGNAWKVWEDQFDKLKFLVDTMEPDRIQNCGTAFSKMATRMNETVGLFYNQHRRLIENWGGKDAIAAVEQLNKAYRQAQEIYAKAYPTGQALKTHAGSQRNWKAAYGSGSATDSWVQDVARWSTTVVGSPASLLGNNASAGVAMHYVNVGTETSNNQFPQEIRQDMPNPSVNEPPPQPPSPPGGGGPPGAPKMPGGGAPPGGMPGGPGGAPSGPGDMPGGPGGVPGGPNGPGGVPAGGIPGGGSGVPGGGVPGGGGGLPGGGIPGGGGIGSDLASLPPGGGGSGGLSGGGAPGGLPGGGAGGGLPGGAPAGGPGGGLGSAAGGAFPGGAFGKAGGAGAMGMGGMPMGMGAGGGQGDDNEHERSTWLSEDEDVWGGDDETAPPVIG